MMEDQRGLFVAFPLSKIVAHYEDDVNVIWVGLSGDITAKDNEAFEFTSALSEVINVQQTCGHKLALRSSMTKTSDHFVKRSLMDADPQVIIMVEFGKRHSFVRSNYGRAFGNEATPGTPFIMICVSVSRDSFGPRRIASA